MGAHTAKFSLFNGVFCYSAMAAVSYARSPRSVQCSAQASQRTSLQRDMGTLCAGGDENRLRSMQFWLIFHPISAAINAHEGYLQTTIIRLMTTCLRCATRAFFTDVCKQAHAVPASRTRALLTVPVTIAISACPPPQRRRRVLFNFAEVTQLPRLRSRKAKNSFSVPHRTSRIRIARPEPRRTTCGSRGMGSGTPRVLHARTPPQGVTTG